MWEWVVRGFGAEFGEGDAGAVSDELAGAFGRWGAEKEAEAYMGPGIGEIREAEGGGIVEQWEGSS